MRSRMSASALLLGARWCCLVKSRISWKPVMRRSSSGVRPWGFSGGAKLLSSWASSSRLGLLISSFLHVTHECRGAFSEAAFPRVVAGAAGVTTVSLFEVQRVHRQLFRIFGGASGSFAHDAVMHL